MWQVFDGYFPQKGLSTPDRVVRRIRQQELQKPPITEGVPETNAVELSYLLPRLKAEADLLLVNPLKECFPQPVSRRLGFILSIY